MPPPVISVAACVRERAQINSRFNHPACLVVQLRGPQASSHHTAADTEQGKQSFYDQRVGTMIKIISEGTFFYYVPAAKEFSLEGAVFNLPTTTVSQLLAGSDTRLALFNNMLPPNQLLPYWLVWQDGKDLVALDSNVRSGSARDQEFSNALRAIPQRTRCFECGGTFQTLVIDPGLPYPNAPSLDREKILKAKILACPQCGASLRQIVVKIVT